MDFVKIYRAHAPPGAKNGFVSQKLHSCKHIRGRRHSPQAIDFHRCTHVGKWSKQFNGFLLQFLILLCNLHCVSCMLIMICISCRIQKTTFKMTKCKTTFQNWIIPNIKQKQFRNVWTYRVANSGFQKLKNNIFRPKSQGLLVWKLKKLEILMITFVSEVQIFFESIGFFSMILGQICTQLFQNVLELPR